jgi:hypothetical protein
MTCTASASAEISTTLACRYVKSVLAVELKVTAFQTEHVVKHNFYLEALDRDVRKPQEKPAIGLLCAAQRKTAG